MECIMSEQNQEQLSIEIEDIINATKIMEAAIKAGAFGVEDLVKVAPIVDRFIKFSNAIIEQHNKNVEAQEAAQNGGTDHE